MPVGVSHAVGAGWEQMEMAGNPNPFPWTDAMRFAFTHQVWGHHEEEDDEGEDDDEEHDDDEDGVKRHNR